MGGNIRCGMNESRIEAKKSLSANAGQAIPKRILFADDNEFIRDFVSGFLEFSGYEVALAINGIEALAAFCASAFDLVLTDFNMPAMDGFSLAVHIKEKSPSTPIILLTGDDRETVLKKMEKGPVDSVIFKPFMLEDLHKIVQCALAPKH